MRTRTTIAMLLLKGGLAAISAGAQTPHEHAHASTASTHGDHEMTGMYGPYPMAREASGTSWQPEASGMSGLNTMRGQWKLMAHGSAALVYDDQGGPRGDEKLFSP